MCLWDTVLKLYLLNSILASLVNSVRNQGKTQTPAAFAIQTHTKLKEKHKCQVCLLSKLTLNLMFVKKITLMIMSSFF